MPRTPTTTPAPRNFGAARKAAVTAGAGLALAGAGVGIAATGFAQTATPAAAAAITAPAAAGHAAATTRHAATAKHAAPARHAAVTVRHAAARRTGRHQAARHAQTWAAIQGIIAHRETPGTSLRPLPAADKLTPAGVTGAQTYLPITSGRYADATTIVKQALAKKMGLRSAVIAVATAMQESTLENINYGDRDSLGLFQQRPSCGWGTPAQILHPAYAADAFLNALRTYQNGDPGWASQPLWQSAQGVQESGFPTAYAKWEAQAAGLVRTIAPHVV